MKTFKALVIGGMVWFLGVLAYSVSFSLPILENVEQQANLMLFFAVVPLVWAATIPVSAATPAAPNSGRAETMLVK